MSKHTLILKTETRKQLQKQFCLLIGLIKLARRWTGLPARIRRARLAWPQGVINFRLTSPCHPYLGLRLSTAVPTFFDLFLNSAPDAIFCRKWCQMGSPRTPNNPQKSPKIIKSPPQSASRDATLRWPWQKHEKVMKCTHFRAGLYAIRTRLCSPNTLFPFPTVAQKLIKKTSKMLPFGQLLASFGHPNASKCRF